MVKYNPALTFIAYCSNYKDCNNGQEFSIQKKKRGKCFYDISKLILEGKSLEEIETILIRETANHCKKFDLTALTSHCIIA